MKATRVLLCRPTHFSVQYVINPHMKPYSVDTGQALAQWQSLVEVLQGLAIRVDIIEQQPDVPDMVFATDEGIVRKGTVLMANFRYEQRQKERPYYQQWFVQHGFDVRTLSNVYLFEGGDTLWHGDQLLLGTGFRGTTDSAEELATALQVDVVPLTLIDPLYYHLDMCVLILDNATAFYYPPALDEESRETLAQRIPNLYEFSQTEVEGYGANSFVSGDDVVLQAGLPSLARKLQRLGKRVHEVDMSEFKKAGGGIHCLINVLETEEK